MSKLSITTAWNETASFVGRHGSTLFIVAFALIALPSVVFQALGPQPGTPGETPELGLWLLFLPLLIVFTIAGSIAIAALALGRENVVGSAIAHGFRRTLPLFAASILIGLAALIVILPLVFVLGFNLESMPQATPGDVGRFFLLFLVIFVVLMFVWVRLMLMTPVAAAERVGPIGIIRRSWELTSGRFWKLLGFVLLFFIAGMVVIGVISMILGLIIALVAGPPAPGTVGGLLLLLVSGIMNAVFVVFFTTMIARIYAQLAGGDTHSEVFE